MIEWMLCVALDQQWYRIEWNTWKRNWSFPNICVELEKLSNCALFSSLFVASQNVILPNAIQPYTGTKTSIKEVIRKSDLHTILWAATHSAQKNVKYEKYLQNRKKRKASMEQNKLTFFLSHIQNLQIKVQRRQKINNFQFPETLFINFNPFFPLLKKTRKTEKNFFKL